MLGAYASVALVCAGSLVVGQAVLTLCGRRQLSWLAGPVGLAALVTVSGLAIKLPGHAAAVAVAAGALVTAAALVLALAARRRSSRVPNGPAMGTAAALLALLVASIPFIANERVGILGVGLVNDDMAYHLLIADWLGTRTGDMPTLLHQGYPVGPHSLVAGLSEILGTGPVQAFAGLVLAIAALGAAVAYEALRGLRSLPRLVAAVLVAIPYLIAAYLAQEAFKEPLEALFLLAFALLMPTATSPARAVPLGVIAAGAVYTYSFPGLLWLAAAAGIYIAVVAVRRGGVAGGGRAFGVIAAAVAVLAVLTAPEWTRMADFTGFRAFRVSNLSGGLGNLRHQLSPLEALGIWPTSEFRLAASDSGHPAAFYLGAAIAAAAVLVALPRWIRRHGPAVPAALAAAILGYAGARLLGTVYTSAKALAIATPLIALVAFGGLLDEAAPWRPRWPALGLAAALAAGMALSSFLVLRQAPVAPTNHANQLAELRPLVQGKRVLFLGRDNFVLYHLRGSRPFTAVRNYYDPHYVKPDLRLADVFQKFDFDSVRPQTLGRFPYVITTKAAYASGPPPSFHPVEQTPDFVLWKRTAPVGPRRTLAEADHPGRELACRRGAEGHGGGSGRATVFANAPVTGERWSPTSRLQSSAPVGQTLRVPAGRWEVSLQYDSSEPVRLSAPGFSTTLPPNLDYRGSVPYYPAGGLSVSRSGPVSFRASVEEPPLPGRLLGTKPEADLGAIALSPAGGDGPIPGEAERTIPLAAACGRYVDWFETSHPHRR